MSKFRFLFCLSLLAGSALGQAPAVETYARLPLAFEKHGERYVTRGPGYAIGFEGGKATVEVVSKEKSSTTIGLEFAGGRASRAVAGPELPGKVNYYVGNDPKKWETGLPTYSRITYPDVYPGIDVTYYGNQQQLEFDLIVKPGADPESIRLKVEGAEKLSIDDSGAIDLGELRVALPQIYQEIDGAKKTVAGHYALAGRDEVAFRIDSWDHTQPLVIDPTLAFSTLFGGAAGYSESFGIAVGTAGSIFIAGVTTATDFPTDNAAQATYKGNSDAFVVKINSAGTGFQYATYLGGSNYDQATAVAIDASGEAWVTGNTQSTNFPTQNAAQSTFTGTSDAFVTRLQSTGALAFSTYLGDANGTTGGNGIAVNSTATFGYVTGFTYGGTFPTTSGVLEGGSAGGGAFVAKLSGAGAVSYTTLLGGPETSGQAIAVDSSNNAYITGYSFDGAFPGAPTGGAQTTNNGAGDAFVAKLNSTGTALTYFTFLGGSALDYGQAIAVDSSGDAFIGGTTSSTGLATAGAAQTTLNGYSNAFAAELNPGGTAFTYFTYLGGSRVDNLRGLALDGSGNVYVTGYTNSLDFPTVTPVQGILPGNAVSIYSSSDSGSTWTAGDAHLPGAAVDYSINPAGTTAVAMAGPGIYRTVIANGGWTQALATNFSNPGGYLARSPLTSTTIYATDGVSIYQSVDDGVTWNSVGSAPGPAVGLMAGEFSASVLYFLSSTSPYVFKSTNGGVNWSPFATGLPSGDPVVAITESPAGVLCVALTDSVNGPSVYAYNTISGSTWSAVFTQPALAGAPSANPINSAAPYSLSANDAGVYFADGNVFASTDGGTTWAPVGAATLSNAGLVAASPASSSVLYAMTDTGAVVESSNGGATWSSPGTGLSTVAATTDPKLLADPSNAAHALVLAQVNTAAFVAKLNNSGSAVTWSTYLGGANYTLGLAVAAVSAGGNAWVTGFTGGAGFPINDQKLGSFNYGAFLTKISDTTPACSYLLLAPPSGTYIPQYGGLVALDMTTSSGCAWTASSSASWAEVISGASGSGSGTVLVQAAPNTSGATQTATITVGDQTATVTQPPNSCTWQFDKTNYPVGVEGGTVAAYLNTQAGCVWWVGNGYADLAPSPQNGTGAATISVTVGPNTSGASRVFQLPVGGAVLQLTQAAAVQSQTISFPAIPNQILGSPPVVFSAQASSGLPVTLTANVTSVCTVVGDEVVLVSAGTCYITASQAGNSSYSAVSVQQSFTVSIAQASGSMAADIGNGPFRVNSPPNAMAVGDFNGDGLPDLVTASLASQYVTVLTGEPSGNYGTFTIPSKYAIGELTGVAAVAVGDFNGDGFQDIVTANLNSGNVSVLLGDGLGDKFTPAPNSPFAVGTGPQAVLVADFNGDGFQDLAIANSGSNNVTVLLGNGAGGFIPAPGSPIAVGTGPVSLAVADFNADGVLDLAVANSGSNNVTVLSGSGTGAFTAGTPLSVGTTPLSIVAADINQDGAADLVVANSVSNNVTLLINTGTGVFGPSAHSPLTVGTMPHSVVVSDFNGDGKPDIATANQGSDNVTVLLQGASGQFPPAPYSPLAAGAGPDALVVADFNKDGIADLAVANGHTVTVTEYLGEKVGSDPQSIAMGGPGTSEAFGTTGVTVSASAGGSGLDVMFASATPEVCTISAPSYNSMTFQTTVTVTLIGTGTCTIVGSQEGNVDYAAAQTNTVSFTVTAAPQTLTFDKIPNQIFGGSPFAIDAWTSSGLPVTYTTTTPTVCRPVDDLLTLLSAGQCSITAKQLGNANYSAAASVTRTFTVSQAVKSATLTAASGSPIDGLGAGSLAVGDFNGDGIPDLATVSNVLLGAAGGGFSPGASLGTGSEPNFVVAGDFNGDGNQDLAVADQAGSNVRVLLGNGHDVFTPATGSPFSVGTAADPISMAVGDFNSDGYQDLAVATFDLTGVTILQGDGMGGFTALPPIAVDGKPTSVAVADFNGDGIPDLAVADADGLVTVLLGDGFGDFTAATGSPFSVGSTPQCVVVGDFNGDGIPDLATANYEGANVTVLLGNATNFTGTFGFTPATGSPFQVGNGPYNLAVGDLNGDGIPDLAVANFADGNVSVLVGSISGSFAPATGTFSVGTTSTSGSADPASVALADFDGDGRLDLAVANVGFNNVVVLLGAATAATTSSLQTSFSTTVSAGTSVPLTLTVSDTMPGFSAPTGTVTFLDGTTTLGTAGQTTSPYTFTTPGLAAGSHTLIATYGGDTRSAGSTSNSITITVVVPMSQTITFGPLSNQTLGATPPPLTATASSNLPVMYTSNNTTVCTVSTSGTNLTLLTTGTCSITASQPGGGVYVAATPVTQTFTVLAAQTIQFDPIRTQILGVSPFAVVAQASTMMPVTFASTPPTVCHMAADVVTLLSAGTCTVTATQAGNASFGPVSAMQSFAVNAAAPAGTLTFPSANPFMVGTAPVSVAVGDFNGDGIVDLVTADSGGGVSVLLGTGTSSGFAAAVTRSDAGGPASVVVGDFNGDGKQDIAVANGSAGNVTVLLGTGLGAFTAAAGSPFSLETEANPVFLAVGDFNSDGIQDLAVADYFLTNVAILQGNGMGGFTELTPITVDGQPTSVAVADFNGDGFPDVAAADFNGQVTVLLGNGAGGFTKATGSPFTVGSTPESVVVGDFNGDGIPDLATANYGSGNVTVLLGNSTNFSGAFGFTAAKNSPFAVGNGPYSVAVGDLNGDGFPDLAVANYTDSTISVLLGNASGSFAPATGTFSVGAANSKPQSLALADFNNDGRLDLVAANAGANNVVMFLGGATVGTTTTISTTSPATILPGTALNLTVNVSDSTSGFDAPTGTVTILDGSSPIGTANQTTSPYTFSTSNLSTGSHSLTASYGGDTRSAPSTTANAVTITVTAKLNQTIAFVTVGNQALGSTPPALTATASSGLPVMFTSITTPVCTTSGVNGATLTLVALGPCSITASQSGSVTYNAATPVTQTFQVLTAQTLQFDKIPNQLFGRSPFAIAAQSSSVLPVTFTASPAAVCSVAGDMVTLLNAGTCSITATQAGNATVGPVSGSQSFTVSLAKPSGTLTATASSPVTVGSNPASVAVGDFNEDGILDLAVANNAGGGTVLFGGGSGGGFSVDLSASGISGSISGVVGDFNGDGHQDLAVANQSANNVTVVMGDGKGGFTSFSGSPFGLAGGTTPTSMAVGDFNGDGIQDIAVANNGTSNVTVLQGNGSGGFITLGPFTLEAAPLSIAVADMNGDGFPDLVTANSDGNVAVLLGNGAGGFTAAATGPFAAGSGPRSVAVGDFNGDGVPDLAVADFNGGAVTVLLGNATNITGGTFGFTNPMGNPFSVGSRPYSVVVGDFNGDGVPDLAAANFSDGTVSVLLGNGSGGFTPASAPFQVGSDPEAIVAADFDGDGKLDLAAANTGGTTVSVLLGGPAATSGTLSTTAPSSIPNTASVPLTLTVSDTGPAFNTPTGAATFLVGSTTVGTASQTSSPYTFTATGLAPGFPQLSAVYGGDSRSTGSTSNSITLEVYQALTSQTITFAALGNQALGSTTPPLSATASSGLAVTFASITTSVCTTSGTNGVNLTLVTTGTCSITASQAGGSGYAAATPVTQSFTVTSAIATSGALTAASATAAPGSGFAIPTSVCSYASSCTLITPGAFSIPISIALTGGATVNALTFGIQITPNGGAPALASGALHFTPSASIVDTPLVNAGGTNNSVAVAWSSLTTPLANTAALGVVTGTLPANAAIGQSYTVTVTGASGALNSVAVGVGAGTNGTLTVANVYLAGDVAPDPSDSAPNFGDGALNIVDLIQELFAVNNIPGFRPAACSDRLDAMDLFPADTASTRGGDGALDIRDLVLELFRVNNLDLNRPVRSSRGGCSGASGASRENSEAPTAEPRVSAAPRPQSAIQGALALGPPEDVSATEERIPVYLEASQNLLNVAVTFGLGDGQSQLRFVPTAETPPSLAEDSQLGVVAAAWLDGVSVRLGERLLLGYIAGPPEALANLKVYGVSASRLDDNREVRLNAPAATALGR